MTRPFSGARQHRAPEHSRFSDEVATGHRRWSVWPGRMKVGTAADDVLVGVIEGGSAAGQLQALGDGIKGVAVALGEIPGEAAVGAGDGDRECGEGLAWIFQPVDPR